MVEGAHDGLRLLDGLARRPLVARDPEVVGEVAGDAHAADLVVQPLGQRLRLPEQRHRAVELAEQEHHVAQRDPEVDRLLERRPALGQVGRGRRAPARSRSPPRAWPSARRPCRPPGAGSRPRCPRPRRAARDGPGAPRARRALRVEPLEAPQDPRVERAAPVRQEARVRDLVGERVAEGVLEVGEEPRLVEELGRHAAGPGSRRSASSGDVGDRREERAAARPCRSPTADWSRRFSSAAAGRCARRARPAPCSGRRIAGSGRVRR